MKSRCRSSSASSCSSRSSCCSISFRSIVVALKAIVLNLLSVGAAYGILVAVFQWGWGENLLDFESNGGITPWLPMFLFVILFGLSMDYHVFILSRVREAYDRGLSNEDAVAHGIKSTAGVVTSAAVVMVGTFSVFALLPLIDMKEMGIGLAAASPDRRHPRPRRAAARDDEAARRAQLVPAEVARVAAPPRARAGLEAPSAPDAPARPRRPNDPPPAPARSQQGSAAGTLDDRMETPS